MLVLEVYNPNPLAPLDFKDAISDDVKVIVVLEPVVNENVLLKTSVPNSVGSPLGLDLYLCALR